MTKTLIWSYGGGIQTAAIAVLVHRGVLPKPDLSVIADTTRESPTTWEYLDNVMRPYMRQIGVEIDIASHDLSKVDLYRGDGLLLPAYHANGKLVGFCSGEWKREVIKRYARSKGVKECDNWIGYSYDEKKRRTKDHKLWFHLVYPLIEMVWPSMTRDDCIHLIKDEGLPVPNKSRCWMCPHQDDVEWLQVKTQWPELFGKAVEMEAAAREMDEQGGLWFHRQKVPLDVVKLEGATTDERARGCDGEGCFT